MKLSLWIISLFISAHIHANEMTSNLPAHTNNDLFKKSAELFSAGKYLYAVDELTAIEIKLNASKVNKNNLGLVYYWKGICFNRLQEFQQASTYFKKSLENNFSPIDINYEYGQALYASEEMLLAREQFKQSAKRKFKRAISLYYIGFISKELGENKRAYSYFASINKLEAQEAQEVLQASEMQIGDLYLGLSEKKSDAFKAVEDHVIPQYKKAYDLDPSSGLAPLIQEKIVKLQQKYQLILFELQNGRPTANPPYFIRLAQEFGQDSNVTFSPAGTTVSKSRQASKYSKTDFLGKYTFYYKNFISLSPEFRFTKSYYFNRVPEVYRNDNQLFAPSLRTTYEHKLWSRASSFLLDYDFNEAQRDVESKEKLVFSSRTHSFMLGERFNYFNFGETTLRLRRKFLESYVDTSNSSTTSFVFEQIKNLSSSTFLFYFSYDQFRVRTNSLDTNSMTFRSDYISGRVFDFLTPSIGFAATRTDPINNRATRGQELLINPNARVSMIFKKSWRATFRYDYQKNNSRDKENYDFTKTLYALELEYLF